MDGNKKYNILSNNVFDFEIFPMGEPSEWMEAMDGSNQKLITVVYAKEADPKEDLAFLKKIMAAVKLDLAKDLQVIGRTKEQKISFSNMRSLTKIEKLLIFGKYPRDLGLHFSLPAYQPMEFGNIFFLRADSLATIAGNKEKKAQLWAALQQMFLGS